MQKVGIAGLSGYSGQELRRLIDRHPHFRFTRALDRNDTAGTLNEKIRAECDIVFLCTPAETSLELAPRLIELGVHVVDLSGAFRLKKFSYPEWYGFHHVAPELLAHAEFGLFPWRRLRPALPQEPARLVANPGCFSTAAMMTLIPLINSKLVRPESIVIDAKSGTTGAGRKGEVRLLHAEIFGDFAPYRVGRHQHWPEIVETVGQETGVDVAPCLVTELLPVDRGISAAIFAEWANPDVGVAKDAAPGSGPGSGSDRLARLAQSFRQVYSEHPDVRIHTDGALLSMKSVVGTNRVHISLAEAYGRPVIFTCIDNLLRGAAGQALMNANQLAGRAPTEGLE